MGLPSQLDGAPKGLKLKNPKVCPHCHSVIETYKTVTKGKTIILVCPRCGEEIKDKD